MNATISVLLPLRIDNWRSSIATQMRAVVEANPHIHFFAFSKPTNEEDRANGTAFWQRKNVTKLDLRTFLQHKYDVVQLAHLSIANIILSLMAKLRNFGQTKIVSIICLEIVPEDANAWRRYHYVLPWADYFLSVSHAAGELTKRLAPARYRGVIHNGYDEVYFDPAIVDPDGVPSAMLDSIGRPYLLYVSSLEIRKRTEHLIEMARRMPDVTFVGAGACFPGDSEIYLEEIQKVPNILWLGLVNRRELRWLYKHAAALFFPSDREGLPLAVIEAMGMGLPTIAQPKSSMPDIIVPGENGELLYCEDHRGWENACRHYLQLSAAERESLRQKLNNYAKTHYTWDIAGKKYGDFYYKVVVED